MSGRVTHGRTFSWHLPPEPATTPPRPLLATSSAFPPGRRRTSLLVLTLLVLGALVAVALPAPPVPGAALATRSPGTLPTSSDAPLQRRVDDDHAGDSTGLLTLTAPVLDAAVAVDRPASGRHAH